MHSQFQQFFDCCVGNWVAERTYHYLAHQEVERSRTEFQIEPLSEELKLKVLSDNVYPSPGNLAALPGYHLSFYTVSETGEEVSQQLNFLFVPTQDNSTEIEGDYLRDRAYEEARPLISHFRFAPETHELLMTTQYTRVVSVDSITLVNPNLRIRKIINYLRPPEGQPLAQISLVGFGVEQKGA
ncbi:phycobiliprotein lyase [Oscillatoria sp. FACHB-1406]|uniref:phycobiliprotein lyase n=1 Tax=Oscillatoria sp. FACHB-1406 TaxID=2692846 RepID=UPI001689CFE1|nr:phycobiliprotein lyase [Oscillatoria sp. FACHB-1406]MBD2579883.1 phycobiliprotein lyase [Oscillatoria sp. FACHB-1406]